MKHLRTYFILTIMAFVITSCTDGEQMRQRLAEVQACNQADTVFSSRWLPTVDSLVDYFDSHGTPNERLMAHYLQGRVYHDMGEAPQAIDCYQQAVEQVDTAAEDCDFRTLGCVYSQMADVFHGQLLFTNAIQARKQATYYAFMSNDSINGLYDRRIMAGEYILLQKKDSAEVILRDVIKLYHEKGKVQDVLQASLIQMHLLCDKPEHANDLKQLIDNYDCNSQYFDERHELPPLRRMFYYYKGKYYEAVNQLDIAELYYRKMFHENMPIPMKNSMSKGLLGIYQRRNIPDSIAKYAQLYCEANDSSIAIKDQELTGRLAASYRYNTIQNEVLVYERKVHQSRIQFVVIIAIVSILATLLLYRWRQFKKQKVQEINSLKSRYAESIDTYQHNLKELRLLNDSRKTTISEMQEEFDNERTELCEENEHLKHEIVNLQKESVLRKAVDYAQNYFNTPIVQQICSYKKESLKVLSKKEKDDLLRITNEYYPQLIFDLKESRISPLDELVCILVILQINPSQISNLLGTSPQVVTNLKRQIGTSVGDSSARMLYKNLIKKYCIYAG